jgi:hypothetical protein
VSERIRDEDRHMFVLFLDDISDSYQPLPFPSPGRDPSNRPVDGVSLLMKKWLAAIAACVTLVATWIAADILYPTRHSLRAFDARELARIETQMWRSYYERHRWRLFNELAELMSDQYGMPFWRSRLAAYHAARAAVVFQRGRNREDYLKALPDLERFYKLILRTSAEPFDVKRAAGLELEWWIVHRHRAEHPRIDLERALADLQAEIYRQPADGFRSHAQYRAEAMLLRDSVAESRSMSEWDWQKVAVLLNQSWFALRMSVSR